MPVKPGQPNDLKMGNCASFTDPYHWPNEPEGSIPPKLLGRNHSHSAAGTKLKDRTDLGIAAANENAPDPLASEMSNLSRRCGETTAPSSVKGEPISNKDVQNLLRSSVTKVRGSIDPSTKIKYCPLGVVKNLKQAHQLTMVTDLGMRRNSSEHALNYNQDPDMVVNIMQIRKDATWVNVHQREAGNDRGPHMHHYRKENRVIHGQWSPLLRKRHEQRILRINYIWGKKMLSRQLFHYQRALDPRAKSAVILNYRGHVQHTVRLNKEEVRIGHSEPIIVADDPITK